jgi:glutathione peroxidase
MEESIYDFSAPLLDSAAGDRPVSLADFRGDVLLIVNTASHCGLTPQYAGLENLYRTYNQRGFKVLGFPCNQFGAQEPGTDAEIAAFCEKNYGVSFPIFAKIEVNGPSQHPLYHFLKQREPGFFGFLSAGRIRWNFTKFLADRKGSVAARYAPSTRPEKLTAMIERLLDNA